ncbi:MAG: acyltransferase [Candidatus Kaiserbacteria bacterium]|nr:acyltransferase [Candidatus Kaiserbacteria bacterium]
MGIAIANPVLSTWLVSFALLIALIVSAKKENEAEAFSPRLTQELKGLAILAIIFSHIGYFLASDHQFLFPLSIMAGVGVNIFLFLSGFGLTASALARERTSREFYLRHLPKLFAPLWIALALFLALDFFVLHISYDWQYIMRSFLGFFPSADLYTDIDSPLWYFTLAFFYYLLFPIIFIKKKPWLSAFLIYAIVESARLLSGHALDAVARLYSLHMLAFPLGMLFAWTLSAPSPVLSLITRLRKMARTARHALTATLLIPVCYFAYFSGVGGTVMQEQSISILVVALLVLIFIIKQTRFGILYLFGIYSYEIYLLHWPILYRYDALYKNLPAWLATILYLIAFLGIAYAMRSALHLMADTRSR